MSRRPAFRAIVVGLALALLAAASTPALGALDLPSPLAARQDAYPVSSTTRLRVSFESGGAVAATRIVRAGDALEAPPAPTAPEGKVFSAWSVGSEDLTPYLGRALTDADIASLASAGGASEDAQRLCSVAATAGFADAFEVRFHQFTHAEGASDARLESTLAFSMLTDAAGSIDLSAASRSFTPVTEGTDARLVGWEAYGPGAAAPSASYDADQTVSGVTGDLELYPSLSTGFTVALDTGSAPVVESLFVRDDGGSGTLAFDRLPTAEGLGANFYPGYTFGGWFRDEGHTDQVTGDVAGITEDMTLYARWDPATTTYTVVNMVEGPENKPGEGRYTYYSSLVGTGTTGELVSQITEGSDSYSYKDTAGSDETFKRMGYHIPDADETGEGSEVVNGEELAVNAHSKNQALTEARIAGDGSTVVKLYWNRNRLKITFKGSGVVLAADEYVKYGEKISELEHDNSITNFLASYRSGKGRLIGAFEVAPYVIDEEGDPCLLDTGDTEVPIESLVDKYVGTCANDDWSWKNQYESRDYMKCMPGVDYTGQNVVTRTLGGNTSQYYQVKSTIEVTTNNVGLHRGAAYSHWAGGEPYGSMGYLYGYRLGNGSAHLDTGATYYYMQKTLIHDSSFYGGYGCEVFYWPYSYMLSFANTIGSSVNETASEEPSITLEYGALTCAQEPASKYVVGETTRNSLGRTYVFDGWYLDPAAASNYRQPDRADYRVNPATHTMSDGPLALYAGWTPVTHPVTFDSVGGQMAAAEGATLSDDKSTLAYAAVESGSTLARPETPTKTVDGVDYTFTGWYKDAAYTVPWDFATSTVQGETTLFAKWVKGRSYGVTYHDEAGDVIPGLDDGPYRYGARVNVAPLPASQAQDKPFLGWSLVRGNASRVVGQAFTISSNTDLFAVFGDAMPGAGAGDVEAGAPVLTLVSDYPSGVVSPEVTRTIQAERANAAVTLPSSLDGASAPCYHVVGWATEPGGAAAYGTGERVAVAANATLYAVWEANQLSAALDASLTYDGTAHEPEPSVTGWDGSALVAGTDYELSWARNVHAHAAEGDGAPTVTVTGAGDYDLSEPVELRFAIAPRPVTVTADNKASRVGEVLAQLTASVTSGSVVSGDDLGLSPYTANAAGEPVEVDTAHAGTYSILVTHAGSADYAVTVVPGTYRVTSASLVVSAQGWSGTYDGQPHAASVALSPAAAAADGAGVRWSTSGPLDAGNYGTAGSPDAPSRTAAGTTTAWYYVQGTESYQPDEADRAGSVDISVAPAPLTARAADAEVTYGEGPANRGIELSGLVGSDTQESLGTTGLTFAYVSRDGEAYEAGSPAGSYRIVPSGLSYGNYAVTYAAGTLTVGRRSVSVGWSDADSMPYTGSARTYAGATLGNLFGTDLLGLDVSGTSATSAGVYTATVTGLSGPRASSYALPSEGLSHRWEITKASNSATVAIDDWTYGGTRALPTCIAGFGVDTATFEYADSAEGTFAPEPPTTAGTHYVRATIAGTDDYAGAQSDPVAYQIAKVPLTLTANDSTVAYGDEPADAGFALSGFVAGDTAETVEVGGQVAYSFGCGPGSPVGDYEIVPDVGGAWAANYDLVPAAGTLHVVRAANSWVTPPAVGGWVAGQAPSAPSAAARFGEPSFSYRPAGAGDDAWSPEPPAAAGPYEMRAHVAGTDNYLELSAVVGFEVADDTLAYDANSALAAGSTGPQSAPTGAGVEVLGCGFSWPHHDFLGWNTARDGTGEAYAPGATYVLTGGDDVLYAQWDPRGELAYDGNGATSGSVPPQPGSAGEAVTVAANGFARDGFDFLGWNTAADGSGRAYAPGDALALSLGGDVLYAQWRARATPAQGRPMYRLYNPNSGEHFYTERAAERDAVVASGWSYEGVGWVAPASGGDPVFRLYNPNAGDHHYTLDAGERDALVAVGWRYEGVGWRSDPRRGVRVWRQYNPNATAGAHNFTTSEAEHVFLCGAGWRGEGVAWYGVR